MQQEKHRREPPDQQFTHFHTQGSSRVHAGNSYVEQQNVYYASQQTSTSASSKLQDALAFPEMGLRSVNIPYAQPQTCGWLFESAEYKRWLDPSCQSKHHGVLWLKGKPGAGKSTLMKAALRHARAIQSPGKLASFFFNARGQGLEKSTEGMYRALLHQVVLEVETLPDLVEPAMLAIFEKKGWPLDLLKDLFRETLLWFGVREGLVCYIDALDECDEDAIRDMLALFEELAASATSDHLGFSVCFASRHYPNIKVDYREEIVLDDIKAHHDDISIYVQRRLKVHNVLQRHELANEIMQTSSGVFMWVVLVVAILNKFDDRGDVHSLRARLREIPPTLQELFDDIVSRDGTNENLVPIIQWTLFAGRPMGAAELYHAVMVSTNQLETTTLQLDDELMNGRALHNFILASSKGFLQVEGSNPDGPYERDASYEFFHESVREYFLAYGLKRLDPDLETDPIGASHTRLARSCAAYIDLFPTGFSTAEGSPDIWTDRWSSYPFLKYVNDYGFLYHADEAAARGDLTNDFYAGFSLDKWWMLRPLSQPLRKREPLQARYFKDDLTEPLHSSTQSPSKRVHWRERDLVFSSEVPGTKSRMSTMRRGATLLHILVDCGFVNLVQRELNSHAMDGSPSTPDYVNAQCGRLGTALHIAVHHGDTKIIRLLLAAGADRNVQCKVLGTPKEYAASLFDNRAIHALRERRTGTTSNDASVSGRATEAERRSARAAAFSRSQESQRSVSPSFPNTKPPEIRNSYDDGNR
jgi:hypothetical protein